MSYPQKSKKELNNKNKISLLFRFSILFTVLIALLVPQYGYNPVIEAHVTIRHYRNGILIGTDHHPGVLTNIGADFIEQQISGSASTTNAIYIAVSNDASTPQATWTAIPNEITTGGMGRAAGTYINDGIGQWNVTKTYNPTESGSCQLTGLYYASSGDYLLCADTFAQINYQGGTDTVEIIWSLSVSGA